jgi:putative DNA primase/helicase
VLPGWLRQEGFSVAVSGLIPGLVIPVYDVYGGLAFHQYRPDKPRVRGGKPAKYELPARVRMVLDVPRSVNGKLADPAVPLFVTESPLKADAAVSAGLVGVATFGVYGWRTSNRRGGKTALPDFEYLALNGRTVYLVPDSDVATNPAVGNAVGRLGAVLEGRGADVRYVYLPRPADGSKLGLDDYFAAGGTVDGLYALADDEPPEKPPAPAIPSATHAHLHTPPVEAPKLAENRDILAAMVVCTEVCMGLVGEHKSAKLVYLMFTSRLLREPVSGVVKGLSSSGKWFTIECVARLMPPEAVYVMTSIPSMR